MRGPTLLLVAVISAQEGAAALRLTGGPSVRFEPSVGQVVANREVEHEASFSWGRLFVLPGELWLCTRDGAFVRLRFQGARTDVQGSAEEPEPGQVSYLRGGDPGSWRPGVPGFGRLRYRGLYEGIDLVLHGREGELEIDLEAAAGISSDELARVRIAFHGVAEICLDEGALRVALPHGELSLLPPRAYQGGEEIAASFALVAEHEISMRVGDHRPEEPLVVDPVLVYGSFLGGTEGDEGHAIAVDASGAAYVAGMTRSLDFPLASPLQPACGSCGASGTDAFVAKVSPSGSQLVWSTYLGGSGDDDAHGIELDGAGNVHVAGETESSDFPLANPLQGSLLGPSDAFVVRIDPSGSRLSFSTYFGGSGDEECPALAVSPGGASSIAGSTTSPDLPVAAPLQGSLAGGRDAFLARIEASGSLGMATYLGCAADDRATGLAVDAQGAAYVSGAVAGHGLLKLGPRGVEYGVRLGGDIGGVALGPAGAAYVAAADHLGSDPRFYYALVWKVDPEGTKVTEAWLGGRIYGSDSIAVDAGGSVFLTGEDEYYGGFFTCPTEPYLGQDGYEDAFVARLDPELGLTAFATALGGREEDHGYGVAVNGSGDVWVTGTTTSPDFPTRNAFQPGMGSGPGITDAFVARVASAPPAGPPLASFSPWSWTGGEAPFTVSFGNVSRCTYDTSFWSFGDGGTSTETHPEHTYQLPGRYTVSLTVGNSAGSDSEVRPGFVDVQAPIEPSFTATPLSGPLPLTVSFTDTSSGTYTAREWRFGDGGYSTAANPVHTYTSHGKIQARLSLQGPFFSEGVQQEIFPYEVAADFTATPAVVRPRQPVRFTDRSLGSVQSHSWYFGDGERDYVANPVHAYTAPGLYTVSLWVYGPTYRSDWTTRSVRVSSIPPAAIVAGPGPDPRAAPEVRGFDAAGWLRTSFPAYGTVGYGVNVGAGDIDGAAAEILTGPGPSPVFGPQVRAFTPWGNPLAKVSFYAYGTLRYGVNVAAATVDADAPAEIVTGAPPGAIFGPHVRGFDYDGIALAPLPGASFFAFGTTSYGVNVAPDDLLGTGREAILASPGPGPAFGSTVRAFLYGPPIVPVARVSFSPFPRPGYGSRASASDLDGDGRDDVLAGLGPGPAHPAEVRSFHDDGARLSPLVHLFFAAFPGNLYGVEPRGGDLDGDGDGDILAARGSDPAGSADLRGFEPSGCGAVEIRPLTRTPYATSFGAHAATGALPF